MTQQNEARRAAIRAHMAEHDVSYTTALRHFEASDRLTVNFDSVSEALSTPPSDVGEDFFAEMARSMAERMRA